MQVRTRTQVSHSSSYKDAELVEGGVSDGSVVCCWTNTENQWKGSDSLLKLTSAPARALVDACWRHVLTLFSESGRAVWSHSAWRHARTWNTPVPPVMPQCTFINACESHGKAGVEKEATLARDLCCQQEKACLDGILHIWGRHVYRHMWSFYYSNTYIHINCHTPLISHCWFELFELLNKMFHYKKSSLV